VFRNLRFQLIAIVLATVASVLAASQWLDTSLSESAFERDLKERALLALRTVDSLWGRSNAADLEQMLNTLVESDREIVAIDIFRLDGTHAQLEVAARENPAAAPPEFTPEQVAHLLSGGTVTTRVAGSDGGPLWRVAVPLRRAGAVVGTADADLSLAEAARLTRRLRAIDGVFLLLSIGGISFALALFLERRVTRPVAELVDGMRRAEGGALGARVALAGGGEFAFLAGSFNRMLGRIEELTAGLESRVRAATRELADKNRELQDANERLWRAQLEIGRRERLAAVGQMAATIAHELGTPLNSVLGYTQLLLREDLAPEQADKLAIVESQVQRMIETIRSVLDRTRESDVRRVPVAIPPLVAEALDLVAPRIAGRELSMRSEVPANLPPVPADAVGLRQVLLNLLTNAIDATEPPGTITVSATLLMPNGRGGQVELVVRDTGHGMAAEDLSRVFQPFYTTKAPGRGTGLGLVIVDHIVRAHGGQVLVESMLGQGTTMRVRLPLED